MTGLPSTRAPADARRNRRGFVLLTILVLVMLASMIAASLLYSVRAEVTAQTAGVHQEQAWATAMSGVARAIAFTQSSERHLASWADAPAAFQHQFLTDDGSDRWFFSLYAASDSPGAALRFGLTDEAGKLSLENPEASWLARLPGLDAELTAALIEGREVSPSTTATESPVPTETIPAPNPTNPPAATGSGVTEPSRSTSDSTNAPSITPARLAGGSTPPAPSLAQAFADAGLSARLLEGEDANQNLRLDPNEDDGDALAPLDDRNGVLDLGLQSLLTLVSYEPNVDSSNRPRANLNDAESILSDLGLPQATLDYLAALRRAGRSLGHPVDLLNAEASLPDPQGRMTNYTSGLGPEQLPNLLDRCTATNATRLTGLLNINTAPRPVLAALTALGEAGADTVLATRSGLSAEERRTPAWLLQRGILTVAQFKELAPRLTTRSFQFSLRSVGYAIPSGRYRVLAAIIDIAPMPARILALQDLTRSGFPVPLELLQSTGP